LSISTELLLALLIVGFYLKDSLLLLRADEAVFVRGLRRWHAGFGARGFKLGGREPYLANPFTPHVPVYRLAWSMPGAPVAAASRPLQAPAQLAWLAPFAWVAWLLLFVAIPATVLAHLGTMSTLAAVLLLYLDIAAGLVVLFVLRKPLGIGGRAYALLAFECLVCAPYAANLVRRAAAAGARVDEDFTAAAARLLPAAALADVQRECLARIDEQLEAEAENSAAAQALTRGRARFAAAVPKEETP
jgi:hypothetical protein